MNPFYEPAICLHWGWHEFSKIQYWARFAIDCDL
jgi:hypothetical protein